MTEIVSKPGHGSKISTEDGIITPEYQAFLDELEQRLNVDVLGNVVLLPSHTVATLPSTVAIGSIAFVSNETGGSVIAFYDGTDWRRSTDRAIVS